MWPDPLCSCVYAAGGPTWIEELHLQSLCYHGGDSDKRQNYQKRLTGFVLLL